MAIVVKEFDKAKQLLAKVADYYHFPMSDYTDKGRTHLKAFHRFVAMYVIRKLTNLSLPDIAELFDYDHTSVIHGINHIERRGKLFTMSLLRQFAITATDIPIDGPLD